MAAQCWQCIFAVKCGFGVTLFNTVASLGLMSPGAVTDGVTLFFLRKLTTSLVIVLKGDDLFYSSSPLLAIAFQMSLSPVPFVKFSPIFLTFIRLSVTPSMVSSAAVRHPHLVTPLL